MMGGWEREGEIEAGGRRLAFAEAGPESDLLSIVFIHGAGGSRKSWSHLLHDISRLGLHAIALELPGHGASPGQGTPPGQGSRKIGSYAETVEAFIEARGLARPVLAGHSMGGAVALTCGLNIPARRGGVVLTWAGSRLRVMESILAGVLSNFEATAAEIVDFLFAPSAPAALAEEGRRQLLECSPEVVHGDFSACDGFDERNRIGDIALPSLILCGDSDRLTPPTYSQFLAEKLPSAELRIIPDAGHMVMVEQPRRVGEEIRRFMDSLFSRKTGGG